MCGGCTGFIDNSTNVHVLCVYLYNYRINQWKDISTLWLHGYWQYDWADNYVKVSSIDHSSNEITIDPKTRTLYSKLSMYNSYNSGNR